MTRMLAAMAALTVLLTGAALAQPAAPPAPAPPAPAPLAAVPLTANDYGATANWLCWPGRANDACAVDLTATVVNANGTTRLETARADPNAPIDCFYVYPTVSRDPGAISDLAPGPEELNTVSAQLARFGLRCRLYAPMYRQFTLTALTAFMTGRPLPPGAGPEAFNRGYLDVVDAWNWYLANENHGRGVVLIGHSQGSGVLQRLIADEIDGRPSQRLMVSALLLGWALPVPRGADVGGAFHHIPVCRAPAQTGCVIAYASFRDTATPENSAFGRVREPGQAAVCANPANLAPLGQGEAHSYLSNAGQAWVTGGEPVRGRFVAVPGLITARCVDDGTYSYLSIHVNGNPADPRVDDIHGDVMRAGQIDRSWGLHLIDTGLFMGDLVDIVGAQSAAWRAAQH